MKRVGIVGWRGMVGSVLLERMQQERDLESAEPAFFTTSMVGSAGPSLGGGAPLLDASDVASLVRCDIIVSCQGGEYTERIHPRLRGSGWKGYWIDAASALRMREDAVIVLDPVNMDLIKRALSRGVRDFIGGNCTVSLMLMGLHGLFEADLVEWLTAMTYQAASGAGAQHMRELLAQMGHAHASAAAWLDEPERSILDIDEAVSGALLDERLPSEHFGAALAGNLLPWIDKDLGDGRSREEWKAAAEGNKILGRDRDPLPMDGICVRIGAMRCHSQALTLKLKRDVPLDEIEDIIAGANEWVKVVPNTRDDSLRALTPVAVARSMTIPVGRLRKLSMGRQYLTAFTVGDQLLWGAAEPLRRMLRILLD